MDGSDAGADITSIEDGSEQVNIIIIFQGKINDGWILYKMIVVRMKISRLTVFFFN